MYFVLYDKNLNSIGETYLLESWHRVQRAIDFDEANIVGEQIPYSAEPFFVVVNNPQGKQKFSGLASTPIIDEKTKKTSITLKDYLTLMNTEIIVNWSTLGSQGLNLSTYLSFVLNLWISQTDVGFSNIVFDTTDLEDIPWDTDLILGTDSESVLVSTLVLDAMNLYNVYCIPVLNVSDKELKFQFFRASTQHITTRLKDIGNPLVEKSFGDYNRATVYTHDYVKKSQWVLLRDNRILKMPITEQGAELLYPAKNRNFIAEKPSEDLTKTQAVYNATYDAVMGLAENRYQENIDIDLQQYKSILGVESLDFSYSISVYAENDFYKELPVGEIETDSKGTHIVRLGRRVQELTQEV